MRAYCAALLLAAAVGCRAQTDSAQANRLAVGLNFMTHGETCGGGLPRSGDNKPVEDRSHFLMGRLRLNVDYERKGLQVHATIQNKAPTTSPPPPSRTMPCAPAMRATDIRCMPYWPTTRIQTRSIAAPTTTVAHSSTRPCRPCGITTTCRGCRWAPRCSS